MKNFRTPEKRESKLKLLKALMKGEVSLDDLRSEAVEVWRESKKDSDYMECLNPEMHITKDAYEQRLRERRNTKFIKVSYGFRHKTHTI